MKEKINRADIAQKEVLTRAEAAAYMGYSVGYVNQLCARRAITFYKPLGKATFFKRTELEAWMCRNRIKTFEEINSEAARA